MYHAQCAEDINLRKFFPEKHDGFYIDVGAWDANVDSVTKHFYDDGWRGINIEPIPEYHARVAMFRDRDINLQVALGAQNETRKLHYIHDSGLSTFNTANVDLPHNNNRQKQEIFVTTLTLERLCEKFLPIQQLGKHGVFYYDFLKVDVEGWEFQVFQGANFVKYRPRVIVVEATVPGTSGKGAIFAPDHVEWDALIKEANYEHAMFDGLNEWYVDTTWEGKPSSYS